MSTIISECTIITSKYITITSECTSTFTSYDTFTIFFPW